MEGNNCYRYINLKIFISDTSNMPIKAIIEIGTNVGKVAAEIVNCFPDAKLVTYEMIEDYYQVSKILLAQYPNVEVKKEVVCAKHLYEDDFGQKPRKTPIVMHAFFALPDEKGLHLGGSIADVEGRNRGARYKELSVPLVCRTLDEVVQEHMTKCGVTTIDYIKSDAEGAENNFLGCATKKTLESVRYMAGEYHNFNRFWPVAQKMMETHFVNLSGHPSLGSFFFELKTDKESFLQKEQTTNIALKDHAEKFHWNMFDSRWDI